MQTLIVRNPNALLTPAMQTLLKAMVDSNTTFAPLGLSSIAQDLLAFVKREDHFMIVVVEKGVLVAITLLRLPQDNMFPYPTIAMAYNGGTKAASQALSEKALDIVMEAGYTSLWTHNMSGKSDAVFKRNFSTPKGTITPRSTLMELALK